MLLRLLERTHCCHVCSATNEHDHQGHVRPVKCIHKGGTLFINQCYNSFSVAKVLCIFFLDNTTDGADRYLSASRIAGEISPSVRKLISGDLFGLHLFIIQPQRCSGRGLDERDGKPPRRRTSVCITRPAPTVEKCGTNTLHQGPTSVHSVCVVACRYTTHPQ